MKTYLLIAATFCLSIIGQSQNTIGKSDDLGRMDISSFVSDEIKNLPSEVSGILENKLSQIITQNGIGGSYSRFIITPNIVVLTKDITPTAPAMTALTLEITFYIGDGVDGKKFTSQSLTLKGADINETKAYISAIKNINPRDPALQSFVEKGKQKIIEYYNAQCDFIIKEAQMLESQGKFEDAIYKLTSVPEVCADCFKKCMDAVGPIYKKQIDKDCLVKLAQANNFWTANQDKNSANLAGLLLASVDPQASCFKEIKSLFEKIGKRILEVDKREWDLKLKNDIVLEKDRIKAYRDVGVAWGNGQPKSVAYNIHGWW